MVFRLPRPIVPSPVPPPPPTDGLNLPEEFWEAQPFLRAVRDAADAGLASRDAVLGSALPRSPAGACGAQ